MGCARAAVHDQERRAVADGHVVDQGAVAVDETLLSGEDVDLGVGLGVGNGKSDSSRRKVKRVRMVGDASTMRVVRECS